MPWTKAIAGDQRNLGVSLYPTPRRHKAADASQDIQHVLLTCVSHRAPTGAQGIGSSVARRQLCLCCVWRIIDEVATHSPSTGDQTHCLKGARQSLYHWPVPLATLPLLLFETGSYIVLTGLELTSYVDQAFELMEIDLPLPSRFWDSRHPSPPHSFFLLFISKQGLHNLLALVCTELI